MGGGRGTEGPWGAVGFDWPVSPWPTDGEPAVDVCVVGAGISGLLVAYELACRGRRVAVLDARRPCAGETGRSTAHLASMTDMGYAGIESVHGADVARTVAESLTAAIDRIEAIVAEEAIDCDFRRIVGYLAAAKPGMEEELGAELAAALRAGLSGVSMVSPVPLGEGYAVGLRAPNEGLFDPARFLLGVARAFVRRGGRIYAGVRVTAVVGGKTAHVTTDDGRRMEAGAVVVATHSPINDVFALHTKQAAYRTYVLELEWPADAPSDFALWDTDDPYHYARPATIDGTGVLLAGGSDHRTGQADDGAERFEAVETWARRRFPAAGVVRRRWSGQLLQSTDGLAFVGRNPMDDDNVFVVSGDSGNGVTAAAIAGLMLPVLIEGRDHPWAATYSPRRLTLAAAGEFLGENLSTAIKLVGNWISAGEAASIDDVKPGQGALVRDGLSKLAVHRDDDGTLHVKSAVCPHLGCIVRWNGTERSWDCPCHGSRFTARGEPLAGPACTALADRGATAGAPDDLTKN